MTIVFMDGGITPNNCSNQVGTLQGMLSIHSIAQARLARVTNTHRTHKQADGVISYS